MGKARKVEPTKGTVQVPTVDVIADASKKVTKPKSTTKTKVTKPVDALKSVDSETTVTQSEQATDAPDGSIQDGTDMLTDTFSSFLGKLQTLATQMNALKAEFRALEKKATRELKAAQKVNAKT